MSVKTNKSAAACGQCNKTFEAGRLTEYIGSPTPFSGLPAPSWMFCAPCYRLNERDAAYYGQADGYASKRQDRFEGVGDE